MGKCHHLQQLPSPATSMSCRQAGTHIWYKGKYRFPKQKRRDERGVRRENISRRQRQAGR